MEDVTTKLVEKSIQAWKDVDDRKRKNVVENALILATACRHNFPSRQCSNKEKKVLYLKKCGFINYFMKEIKAFQKFQLYFAEKVDFWVVWTSLPL